VFEGPAIASGRACVRWATAARTGPPCVNTSQVPALAPERLDRGCDARLEERPALAAGRHERRVTERGEIGGRHVALEPVRPLAERHLAPARVRPRIRVPGERGGLARTPEIARDGAVGGERGERCAQMRSLLAPGGRQRRVGLAL